MANAASFFTRVLADIFPGTASNARHATSSPPKEPATPSSHDDRATVSDTEPKIIGCGASNETHITIAGIPNLFVDEDDCIVQFVPAFDEAMKETQFGFKVLPELEPHWTEAFTHRCNLKEAIAAAIRGAGQTGVTPASQATVTRAALRPVTHPPRQPVSAEDDEDAAVSAGRPMASGDLTPDTAAVAGTISAWGEEKFPRRKPGGPRFYTSFAMRLQTLSGERVLQGEGLKDAISESRCQVGDQVSVRRVRKIKVQAFRIDGTAIVKDGKPVLWDKWIWSIST